MLGVEADRALRAVPRRAAEHAAVRRCLHERRLADLIRYRKWARRTSGSAGQAA
jgi:hypothetical protein